MRNQAKGFSTGTLHRTHTVDEAVEFLIRHTTSDAIELSFLRADDLLAYSMGSETPGVVADRFAYRSIHAPAKDFRYDAEAGPVLERLEVLSRMTRAHAVVLHPDKVDDWKLISEFEIPWALENLGLSSEASYVATAQGWFETVLPAVPYNTVIDLQHVHEWDPSMGLAEKLADSMADRLTHLHVSGRSYGSSHSLLVEAPNWQSIREGYRKVPPRPVILEGVPLIDRPERSFQMELDLLYGQF